MKWFILFALLAFVAAAYAQEAEIVEDGDLEIPETKEEEPAKKEEEPKKEEEKKKPGLASKIGGEILKGVGEGLKEITDDISKKMDEDESKWIKDAAGRAGNADTINDLFERIKSGDLVVPDYGKRSIDYIAIREKVLAKLDAMYNGVRKTINDNVARAEDLYNEAKAKLEEAYEELKENDKVKELEAKVKDAIDTLQAKAKDIAGKHKRASTDLRENMKEDLFAKLNDHFSDSVSKRFAENLSEKVNDYIEKIEKKVQALSNVAQDKANEFSDKYLQPLVQKLDEIKNSPAVQEKLQKLGDLYQKMLTTVKDWKNGQ